MKRGCAAEPFGLFRLAMDFFRQAPTPTGSYQPPLPLGELWGDPNRPTQSWKPAAACEQVDRLSVDDPESRDHRGRIEKPDPERLHELQAALARFPGPRL